MCTCFKGKFLCKKKISTMKVVFMAPVEDMGVAKKMIIGTEIGRAHV